MVDLLDPVRPARNREIEIPFGIPVCEGLSGSPIFSAAGVLFVIRTFVSLVPATATSATFMLSLNS